MESIAIETASPDLSFPWRLYILLRDAEKDFPQVISWMEHSQGKVFQIHDPKEMEKWVLEKYFTSNRYSSFRRQLIAYQFVPLGNRQYSHEHFSRGNPQHCERVVRAVKGKKDKKAKMQTPTTPVPVDAPPRSYAEMYMARIVAMSTCISPDLGDRNRASAQNGISVSPATLTLSPSAVSVTTGSGQSSPVRKSSPVVQGWHTSSSGLLATHNMGNGNRACGPDLQYDAKLTFNRLADTIPEDETCDPLLAGMDLEPLPYNPPFDDKHGKLPDLDISSHSSRKLPIMTDHVLDPFGTTTHDAASKHYHQQRKKEEQRDLNQLWMDMAGRLENLLEPRNIQDMISLSYTTQSSSNSAYSQADHAFDTRALLEPRPIEEMVAIPQLGMIETSSARDMSWANNCPSMAPEQQAVFEYMLPLVLPALFFVCDISAAGHAWALLLIVGHTIECMCTNFGGNSWYIFDVIGPIQHLQMDMWWNHVMHSCFFLCGPDTFGPNCYYVALVLVPTLPTVLAVDLKSHFLACVLTNSEKQALEANDKSPAWAAAIELNRRLGRHVRRSTMLYIVVMAMLALSSLFGNSTTQALAVFSFNMCPLLVDLAYWEEFSDRIETLPVQFKTVLNKRHVGHMQNLLRTMKARPKLKVA